MNSSSTALVLLRNALHRLSTTLPAEEYRVPALWCAPYNQNGEHCLHNVAQWYLDRIETLLHAVAIAPAADDTWLNEASLYCLLPRHFSAYNHYAVADESLRKESVWNCRGSFLKTIALLPYLQSIGIDTLYLLPFMKLAKVSRKGDAGSVYAQANVLELDETLDEPVLDLSLEVQFQALVEAAHRLGMRVIVEFALRTTSRDADWIAQHPEWYYWVHEECLLSDFHPPKFDARSLEIIRDKVARHDFHDLPAPSDEYQRMFCPTPQHVELKANGEYVGVCEDGSRCMVPGAFADYPPDDVQPLWSDVTYLRLHKHPSFNYVAYNTVRMFDTKLNDASSINEELWNRLASVIPSFIERFDIDGAVLDMCHALPMPLQRQILSEARARKQNFVFIEENFETTLASAQNGFNAVLGDFWIHCSSLPECEANVRNRNTNLTPIPFLACADTHNSPRVFGRNSSDDALGILELSLNCSGAIRCILAGTEFGCSQVMNTGLGFKAEELVQLPASSLPLFSHVPMNWNNASINVLEHYRKLRRRV